MGKKWNPGRESGKIHEKRHLTNNTASLRCHKTSPAAAPPNNLAAKRLTLLTYLQLPSFQSRRFQIHSFIRSFSLARRPVIKAYE